jgi:hypothetical protein
MGSAVDELMTFEGVPKNVGGLENIMNPVGQEAVHESGVHRYSWFQGTGLSCIHNDIKFLKESGFR